MKFSNKTIGIWGYGRVGHAAARFFSQKDASVIIYDDYATVTPGCPFSIASSLDNLFDSTNALLPSPGIDTRQYRTHYKGKWLTEVDLFQHFFHKKIIAITGSVGKTTVTHLLTQSLQAAGWRVQAAGNVGLPMLSVIEQQETLDAVVLELSSFQLEYAHSFAPDLAIWLNLYPNHLDRHSTMQDYFLAKYNLVKQQTPSQKALIAQTLQKEVISHAPQSELYFFNPHKQPQSITGGFSVNSIVVEKALSLLEVQLPQSILVSSLPHRCELVVQKNDITVINDSKSTTPASTLAALQSLNAPRTFLFLGGLSKGIDRSELIQQLTGKPVEIFCFGAEAENLFNLCVAHNIKASASTTLEEAITLCVARVQSGDTILFSPAGSSFDAFKNYEDRGNAFKEIIRAQKIFSDCY